MALRTWRPLVAHIIAGLLFVSGGEAITLGLNSTASSISSAASQIAYDMVSYYTGNVTGGAAVGLLPAPYYWWEAGAMWMGLINYWHYTNDATYNQITTQALLANIGPAQDFIVPDQAFDEGNDDQAFWGMAALTAAEYSFPDPVAPYPSWLQLTEAMWNTQVDRWDYTSCGGGLKWQFYSSNAGYDYKNSVSNGAFFNVAARLLRYTGNTTYMNWAEMSWDWSTSIGLVDPNTYYVYDGSNDLINCTELDHDIWSYNVGLYMLGAATMYNYTNGSLLWAQRTSGLVEAASAFFSPFANASLIMYETMCETTSTCNLDQQSFKAYLASAMYKTTQLAPYTTAAISTVLRVSAQGAASSCVGTVTDPRGITNSACGSRWYIGGFDNEFGVGQQMSALEVIQGLLVNSSSPPGHASVVYLNTTTPAYVTMTALPVPSGVPPTSTATTPTPSATTPIPSKTSTTKRPASPSPTHSGSTTHGGTTSGAGTSKLLFIHDTNMLWTLVWTCIGLCVGIFGIYIDF